MLQEPILRKKLRRQDMVAFFEELPPTVVAIIAPLGARTAAALVFRARDLLVRQQTQVINALRGH